MSILLLIAGLVFLIAGGEALVRSATGIALKADIPPLIVGLTVVSIGTSAPELFASVSAAIQGSPGLAVGNVVGSNIANLALVLGLTALIYPIPIFRGAIYLDLLVLVGFTALFVFLGFDGNLSTLDGALLLIAIVLYTASLIRRSRKKKKEAEEGAEAAHSNSEHDLEELAVMKQRGYGFLFMLALVGGVGLYFGAEWFVGGARQIAQSLNISDYIIGVTVVAFGTSVPELVASIIAALRQQADISIGNLVGSNIYNIGLVLGTTASIAPLTIDAAMINYDFFWMAGIALAMIPILLFAKKVHRLIGLMLFLSYVTYVVLLLQ